MWLSRVYHIQTSYTRGKCAIEIENEIGIECDLNHGANIRGKQLINQSSGLYLHDTDRGYVFAAALLSLSFLIRTVTSVSTTHVECDLCDIYWKIRPHFDDHRPYSGYPLIPPSTKCA